MAAFCHESRLQDAASALARGDALEALAQVGVLSAVPARVLKGIAYAQLGDLELARRTLTDALRANAGDARDLVRARVRAALAEIALGEGDAARAIREARGAADALIRLGDERNASMQELVVARAEILFGKLGNARRRVDELLASTLDGDIRSVALFASAEMPPASSRRRARRSASRLLARMRVEIGRLRKELAGIAEPVATKDGYVLESRRPVNVLLPPTDTPDATVALLQDGAVEEVLEVHGVEYISGLESDRKGGFWCGGENGKLRHVRRS